MSNANLTIPPVFQGGPAAVFGGAGYDEDLAAAIQAGFGLIGYRGKTWSIKYKGDELPLMRPDGDGPLNSIEVIILKAPNHLSKVWYEAAFEPGSSAPPDCASSNGIVPDIGVPKKQNDSCLTCRWNAFGSRPVAAGQTQQFKGKACGDHKRLAVVPLGDILNEQFGGPMLLRVPATSLSELAQLAGLLKQIMFPYYAVGVKISFDTTVAHPQFIFKPMRPLTDAEGKTVMEMRGLDLTDKIVNGDPVTSPPQVTAQPPQEPKPDNVVPMPQQSQPPTQQAAPAKSTGFGGAAATEAPTGQAPAQKTASGGAFGGGHTNGAGGAPEEGSNQTGVAQFDTALDEKLQKLL